MTRRAVVMAVLMAAVLVSPAVAEAKAPDLVCGQLVTEDAVLRSDLICAGDGLIVGASNVTIRLAGHTITSADGAGVGIRFGAADLSASACVENVVVSGGTVSGFATGVSNNSCFPEPTVGNLVSRTTLADNTWATYASGYSHLRVDRTTIVGPNGLGGPFAPSSLVGTTELTRSTIQVTSPDGYSTRAGFTASSSTFEGGTVYSFPSAYLTIADSRLTDVSITCSDGEVTISNSRLVGGAVLGGAVCGYHLDGNRHVGPGSGTAVALGGGFPSEVTNSVFKGWDTALELGQGEFTVTGNTFRDNATGVDVACVRGCFKGTVSGNSFLANSGPGLVIRGGTWHVGSNTARRNGGLGIDASGPGLSVIDDGGNVARRNLPPQCVGVVCAQHPGST